MANTHNKKHSTNRLLKELLLGQLRQKDELRYQRKRYKKQQNLLTALQLQLDQLTSANAGTTRCTGHDTRRQRDANKVSIGTLATDIQQQQQHNSNIGDDDDNDDSSEADDDQDIGTSQSSSSNINVNDKNESVIPWPTYAGRRLTWSKITLEMTLAALERYLIDPDDDAGFSSTNQQQRQQRMEHKTLGLFEDISNVTTILCVQELPQNIFVRSIGQLPKDISAHLVNRLEKLMDTKSIRFSRAENQWLARYFVNRYLKNNFVQTSRAAAKRQEQQQQQQQQEQQQ